MKPYHGKIVTDPALIAELNAGSYEVQPGAHESIHAFNANCKKTGDAMGHVECIPRPTAQTDEVTDPVLLAQLNATAYAEEAATKPTFLQEYGVQTFLSGAALLLVIVIWWTFTRQPALRNNILIGAATLAAFCFNPIAGAIVLAAWIFSRRNGQIKS